MTDPIRDKSVEASPEEPLASAETIVEPSRSAKPRRVLPIHPVLCAAFPILARFSYNAALVPVGQVTRPLLLSILATLVLWGILLLVTRHLRKAAVAVSAIVLAFFSYGHIVNLLLPALSDFVIPTCVFGLGGLFFLLWQTRKPLLDTTAVLNLASIVLIAPSCWILGGAILHHSSTAPTTTKQRPQRTGLLASTADTTLPDVYYIILDAYGRADRLEQFYGYDNSPFIRALEQRGFYVAKRSGANYDQTPLCIGSALSMNYLPDAAHGLGTESLDQLVDDNAVAAWVRKSGFHYVYIGSGLESSHVTTADLTMNDPSDMSPFEAEVLSESLQDNTPQMRRQRYDWHREDVLNAFRKLNTVAALPYPKFVFAHVMAPHPPFVFGPNGEPIDSRDPLSFADASWLLQRITREQYKALYIGQLQFVNKQILESLDAILKQSARPPIIIVQGDHGSRMSLDWESQARSDLREPFSNLNAYYVPEHVRAHLYDSITPVNSFRIILTDVFGANFARLPDRNFYSTVSRPYDFSEVTDLISGPGSRTYRGPTASGKSSQ